MELSLRSGARGWRLAFLTGAVAIVCLHAQTSTTNADGTTTNTTSGVTNGTAAGSVNPTPSTTNATTGTPALSGASPSPGARPIFISGVVLMDDGSALPGNVDVQSICNGLRRTMGHASGKGTFAFQWNRASTAFGDASQTVRLSGSGSTSLTGSRNGSRGLDPLANCDLVAEYGGYSSNKVSLYNRAGQDNFDVGAIVLHRIGANEGHTVSLLALKAPKDAKKSFDKGNALAAANKLPESAESFGRAVELYPEYADAWLAMGKVQWQMLDKEMARSSFHRAMELDAKLVGPWQELGYLACDDSRWTDAVRFLEQAVKLDPMDSAHALYFNALANYNLGRFDAAEKSLRSELKLDGGADPHEHLLLGLVLIARRDLEGGASALRNYLATAEKTEDVSAARRQLAKVENQLASNSR